MIKIMKIKHCSIESDEKQIKINILSNSAESNSIIFGCNI